MDIAIVRHSISVANHEDLISGADSDVALSKKGIDYAKKLQGVYDWQRFDAVYASPLQRARDTAKILTDGKEDVQIDPRLSEMHFGDWDGLSADPFRITHPDAFDYTGMFNANYSKYAPNSESYAHLLQRSRDFLNMLEDTRPSQSVLLVCHGLTTRALFAAALGIDVYSFGAPQNIALNELHLDENDNFRARILTYNRVLA